MNDRNKCSYYLKAFMLHHDVTIDCGHYTSLPFHEGIVHLDDTVLIDVSNDWPNLAAKSVYMAFYCTRAEMDSSKETKIDERTMVSEVSCFEILPSQDAMTTFVKLVMLSM